MNEPSFETSMEAFFSHVRQLLGGTANGKGYSQNGNGRALIDSVAEECGEGHALGEIRYKLVRWRRKRNPDDIAKIAAWAFLEWDRWIRQQAVQSAAASKGNGHGERVDMPAVAQADGQP